MPAHSIYLSKFTQLRSALTNFGSLELPKREVFSLRRVNLTPIYIPASSTSTT